MTTNMNHKAQIQPGMLISEILERWPQTIPVFVRHRMNCVGCEMSIFEALEDAARIYHLSSEDILDELNAVLDHSTPDERPNGE